jgi:hypothetical protein
MNNMNLEKIEWLIENALTHSEEVWADESQSHAYIVGYLQAALENIKYYVEQEKKASQK